MKAYWIEFSDRRPGCIEAPTEAEALKLAEEFGKPKSAAKIGYPAEPRLNKYEDPKWGVCPSFCIAPAQCKKTGSCVNPYGRSCTS